MLVCNIFFLCTVHDPIISWTKACNNNHDNELVPLRMQVWRIGEPASATFQEESEGKIRRKTTRKVSKHFYFTILAL